jgi:mono/diheme cytochrome c family protein
VRRCLTGPLLVLYLLGWALPSCTPDSELSNRELFVKYCSECHGEDGRGNESLLEGGQEVDLLASRHLANGDRDFVYHRIAYGYGQMPAYIHKVDPETLDRLVEMTFELMDETESDTEDPPQTEGP